MLLALVLSRAEACRRAAAAAPALTRRRLGNQLITYSRRGDRGKSKATHLIIPEEAPNNLKRPLQWSEPFDIPGKNMFRSVLWTGGRFVAVGQGGTYLSPNGYDWTRTPNVNWPLTAAYGNGVFVGAQWKGRLLRSNDAITWKQVHKCEFHIEAVTYGA